MATDFSRTVSQAAVAQIAESTGFDTMHESALDILSDLLLRYIGEIGATAHNYAELSNRTNPSSDDLVPDSLNTSNACGPAAVGLLMAFKELGIKVEDVMTYANAQEEVPFAHTMPPYPVQRAPKWPPTFAQRKEEPAKHVPSWLPALPDQHTYVSTLAFAGHDADAKRQRLAATKAKRQAEKSLVRLSERMGTGPGPAIAAPGGNPFLATPSWEAASAAAAADERPDSGVQPSRQAPAAADAALAAAPEQGSLADAFATAAAGGRRQRASQPTGAWAEAGAAGSRPPDALGGDVPAFSLDWSTGGRLRPALPAFCEEEDAFAAAEEAGVAAAAQAAAKGTGRQAPRARGPRNDAAGDRANEILAAGADAVLTMGEDRDGGGGGRDREEM